MSEPRSVAVTLRHVQLTDAAPIHEVDDDRVFVELDAPPPVRTLVGIAEPGQDVRALEISKVVEVPENDERGKRGFYGRFVDDDRLSAFDEVGTEGLSDGEGGQPGPETGEDAPVVADDEPELTTSLGEPAPVVDPDESVKISVAEKARLEADTETGDDETDSEQAPADESVEASGEGEASDDESSATSDEGGNEGDKEGGRRRRRRGRKKR